MISKLLKGLIIASIVVVAASGKEYPCLSTDGFFTQFPKYDIRIKGEEPTEAERLAFKIRHSEYSGVIWCQNCLGGCHYENKIPAGVATWNIEVGCGYEKKATRYIFKIIVRQDNPCFIVSNNEVYQDIIASIRKIDEHTVEIINKKEVWCSITLENFGRRWTNHKYQETDPHSPARKSDNKILLGKDFSCVDEDNVERWEVFVKDGENWKPFAKETFYIQKAHPVLKRLGIE